jgi:hypothetical protein
MSLSSTLNKHIYVGNGVTKTFDYEFDVLTEDDLHIYLTDTINGTETEITSNYSVSPSEGTFPSSNGTVTYPSIGTAISSNYKLTILRTLEVLQPTVYPNNTALKPKVVEMSFDRITMIAQQQQEEIDRCIKLGIDKTIDGMTSTEFIAELSKEAVALAIVDATTAANTATTKAEEAASSATISSNSATTAVNSANSASASATAAASSATNAGTYEASALEAANSANLSAQSTHDIAFTTKSLMDADLAHAENVTALVTNDSNPTNNGIYIKLGASGAGSWQKSAYIPTVVDGSVSKKSLSFLAVEGRASKNLFDKSNFTVGYYIVYTTGNLNGSYNASYGYTDYIPVEASTLYTKTGDGQQLAFYNSSKVYISGLSNSLGSWTTPSTAAYVRLTITVAYADIIQLAKGSVFEYESYGAKLSLDDSGYVSDDMIRSDSIVVKGDLSPNLFDNSKVTAGYYVHHNTGVLTSLAGYYASDYIAIEPGQAYVLQNNVEQGAFFGTTKAYVSGFTLFSNVVTVPTNAYYVRLTVKSENLNKTQFEKGSATTRFMPFGANVEPAKVQGLMDTIKTVYPFVDNSIIVKKDGTGDYVDLYTALSSITDSSAKNGYNVLIYEGEYDIVASLPTAMINNPSGSIGNRGLEIPSYVNLIGVGDRSKTILKGELGGAATYDQSKYLSTLNYGGVVTLQNLTITAKNMRYPIHADSGSSYHNCRYTIKDCDIIHYGNADGLWAPCHAFAAGHGSDSVIRMQGSKFITYGTNTTQCRAWSIHNYADLALLSTIYIDDCECINTYGSVSIHLGSQGSNVADTVMIKRTYVNGTIENVEEATGSGVGIDYTVQGYGIYTTLQTW